MIATSATYNPYTIVRDIDMLVTLPAISETAASHASYTVTGQESISDLTQLNDLNYVDTKYATCEDGLVLLDGSFRFLPDVLTSEHIGWWSAELSPSQGGTVYNQLTATLSEPESVVGFTIYSAKTNPISRCRVGVYNGNTELWEEDFTSDNEVLVIELPVSDFDKVIVKNITMKEPNRRIKIMAFSFGIKKRWNRNSIVSASIQESADYTGNTFPINTLKVEFDNSTHEFDLFGSTRSYIYRTATNTAEVSAEYANQYAVINQVKDIDASESATSSYSGRYATCEDNYVILDSSPYFGYNYIPDTASNSFHIGYFNNALSDEDGNFENLPSVTYSWNKEISISGFRIIFVPGNYATSVTVTAYNDDTIIDTTTVTNDSIYLDIDLNVSGCDKVKFSFASVEEKNRFVKVSKIQVMRNVDSWGDYLTKRQKVIAEFIVNGETIPMGDSYLFDQVKQINGGLTAEITAKSDVAYLDNQAHQGENGTTTLSTAINSVLTGTDISVSYSPSSLSSTTVSKATPKDTTKRAATHYFAQAAKATCYFDRNGVLNIKALEATDYVDEINTTNIHSSDIARMNEYVNMIRLTVKNEYVDPEVSNTYYGGSGLFYRELQNNCVYSNSGTSVATWLLKQYERRVYFEIEHRGNPALELGDTIRITTADGTRYIAVIYDQTFEYNGGLKCTIKAVEATRN